MLSRQGLSAGLVVVYCLLLAGPVVAQPCHNYGDAVHWVGGMKLASGDALDIAVQGNFAYVANGVPGLFVVDIADPQHPVVLGSVDTPNQAWGVAVSGTLAYIADMDAGFRIIDVTNPAAPTLRGGVGSMGSAYDVAVAGNYAYVAASTTGVVVIDVTNPSAPIRGVTVDTPGASYDVCISGGRLYVADGSSGLQVYSLASPAAPVLLGAFDTPGGAQSVVVQGQYAAVADFTEGLRILDVTDPANIFEGSAFPYCGYGARSLAFSATGVGLVGGDVGLQVFDAANFSLLVDQGCVPVGGEPFGIAIVGDFAFVAAGEAGMAVVALPAATTTRGLGVRVTTGGTPVAVAVGSGHVFMSTEGLGLQVFGLADAALPALETTLSLPSFPGTIVLRDSIACVLTYAAGLQIVDVSDPAVPVIIGSFTLPADAAGLSLLGSTVYVAGPDSLRAIDISDPANPRRVCAARVVGEGDWSAANALGVFVGTLSGTVQWFEVIEQDLILRDTKTLGGHSAGLAVQDTVVYAGYAYWPIGGVALFGVNRVSHRLDALADARLPDYVNSLTFDHGLLYVADETAGMQIVDVSNPRDPVVLGSAYGPPSDAMAVAVAGDYAYVADLAGGLAVVPRECLTYVPVFLAGFTATLSDGAIALAWSVGAGAAPGDFRLTAHRDGESWSVPFIAVAPDAWRARDTSPGLVAGGTIVYSLRHRDAGGEWLEVASRSVTLTPPMVVRLHRNAPNPFNPRTTIRFDIPAAGPVRLVVYDVAGRLIRVLADADLPPGTHESVWDGSDAAGRAMASGTYFVRLVAGGKVAVGGMRLVR